MMNKEFVPYDPALALKELGFDEPVFNAFCTNTKELIVEEGEDMVYGKVISNDDTISAPLYQQAFRWFRDKHELWFRPDFPFLDHTSYSGAIHKLGAYSSVESIEEGTCFNYEEAELECLKKLIEIVKNK